MRRILKAILSETAWQAFWTYGASPGIAVLTLVLGYVERLPLAYIVTLASLAFGGLSGGLLWFSQWQLQQTPENKLAFERALVTRGELAGRPSATIGLRLKNTATFSIEAYVETLNTSLAGRINPARVFGTRQFVLEPGTETTFNDGAIQIDGVSDELMIGRLDFKLSYGRVRARRFNLEKSISLRVPLDPSGKFAWELRVEAGNQAGQAQS